MCATLLLWCHAKMNNFAKLDQAVDKSWVALFLSTTLSSAGSLFNDPLNDPFGHESEHAKS